VFPLDETTEMAENGRGGPQRSPYESLTPTQRAVYGILDANPYSGACRRDFAMHDIWELSNRISEIEQRLGITIHRERCRVHDHRHRVVRYRL